MQYFIFKCNIWVRFAWLGTCTFIWRDIPIPNLVLILSFEQKHNYMLVVMSFIFMIRWRNVMQHAYQEPDSWCVLFLTLFFFFRDCLSSRRAFHNTVYFMFFLNVLVGLASCLLRILKTFLFGVLLVGRIDRCLMYPGLELMDKGRWRGLLVGSQVGSEGGGSLSILLGSWNTCTSEENGKGGGGTLPIA